MKHAILTFRSTLIITWLCICSASFTAADVVTNYIDYFFAVDGSFGLQVHLYDTVTSNNFKGSLTIFDKKGNRIVDESRLGGITNYTISHYTGKRLLQSTYEGVPANHGKFILYKVTGKGLKKVGEQVVEHAYHGMIYKSFIGIHQSYLGSNGFTAFSTSFKKQLYTLPLAPFQIFVRSGKGIIVAYSVVAAGTTVKYYKRDKQFAEHYLPPPAEGYQNFITDTKGGLLHWLSFGTFPFPTNLPMTYVTARGEIQTDNIVLEDAEKDWRVINWDGKYFYINNCHTNSIAAYKITRSVVKKGEVAEPGCNAYIVEGSHVYMYVDDGCGIGIVEYDKNLRKMKWSEPCAPDMIIYMGKGIFRREFAIDNGSTGYDTTITIFSKNKIIATHTFTQPYPPFLQSPSPGNQ